MSLRSPIWREAVDGEALPTPPSLGAPGKYVFVHLPLSGASLDLPCAVICFSLLLSPEGVLPIPPPADFQAHADTQRGWQEGRKFTRRKPSTSTQSYFCCHIAVDNRLFLSSPSPRKVIGRERRGKETTLTVPRCHKEQERQDDGLARIFGFLFRPPQSHAQPMLPFLPSWRTLSGS